jgi:hypothetical protein
MGKALPFRHAGDRQDTIRAAFDTVHLAALLACGFVFALSVLGHRPARADTSDGCLAADWIAEARAFVTEETGTPAPEVCVRLAKTERLNGLVFPVDHGKPHDAAVAAVYVPATHEILLADDFDVRTSLARSYLVHELVHAQQFAERAHEHAACPGVLEADAYGTQALYLRTRGLQEEAFLLQVLGMLQSACGYSD